MAATSIHIPLQPTDASTSIPYRPDIDGLRSIAILSVLFYHAVPDLAPGGFVGVDIFFVISGYLISSIIYKNLDSGNFSYSDFYIHRTLRIFPPLLMVMISTLAFGWFTLLPDEYKQLGKHIAASAGFVENANLYFEAGYFDTETEKKPLMHLWSLAVEEQFYLIFPVLICLVYRLKISPYLFLVITGALSLTANIAGTHFFDPTLAFFSPISRFWELIFGGLLALREKSQSFNKQRPHQWTQARSVAAALGLIAIVSSIYFLDQSRAYPGIWAIIPVIGTGFLISSGTGTWVNKKIFSNRPAVFIGKISYPLYLWHWPLLSFPLIITGETLPIQQRISVIALRKR